MSVRFIETENARNLKISTLEQNTKFFGCHYVFNFDTNWAEVGKPVSSKFLKRPAQGVSKNINKCIT